MVGLRGLISVDDLRRRLAAELRMARSRLIVTPVRDLVLAGGGAEQDSLIHYAAASLSWSESRVNGLVFEGGSAESLAAQLSVLVTDRLEPPRVRN